MKMQPEEIAGLCSELNRFKKILDGYFYQRINYGDIAASLYVQDAVAEHDIPAFNKMVKLHEPRYGFTRTDQNAT